MMTVTYTHNHDCAQKGHSIDHPCYSPDKGVSMIPVLTCEETGTELSITKRVVY